MKFIYLALKDMHISLKDKKGFATTILLPIILIIILGLALNAKFDTGHDINKYTIAYFSKDSGELNKILRTDVLGSVSVAKLVDVIDTTDEQGKQMVRSGEASAYVFIPEGFTDTVMKGENASLDLYTDPAKPWRKEITKAVLSSYTSQVSAVQSGLKVIKDMAPDLERSLVPQILDQLKAANTVDEDKLLTVATRSGRKQVSSFQYYTAGMTSMFLLFTGLFGIKSILAEKETGTFGRLLITRLHRGEFLIGKFLGIMLFSMFQVVILYLVTCYVFKVDWGNNLGIVIVTVSGVSATSALAVFITTLAKSSKTTDLVGTIVIQVMALLGGSMIPLTAMPSILRQMSNGTINGWILKGFLKLMQGQGYQAILPESGVLAVISIAFLLLGFINLKFQAGRGI